MLRAAHGPRNGRAARRAYRRPHYRFSSAPQHAAAGFARSSRCRERRLRGDRPQLIQCTASRVCRDAKPGSSVGSSALASCAAARASASRRAMASAFAVSRAYETKTWRTMLHPRLLTMERIPASTRAGDGIYAQIQRVWLLRVDRAAKCGRSSATLRCADRRSGENRGAATCPGRGARFRPWPAAISFSGVGGRTRCRPARRSCRSPRAHTKGK